MTSRPPRLLTIAGSDSGGGAGIQADLKTFAAHAVYGLSVITAITAQNTVAVRAIHDVPAEIVSAQIDAVFEDIGVDAVKIGMLSSADLVLAVAARLRHYRPPIVVLDPVMVAKSGDTLLTEAAITALVEELLPLATFVTPNLPEAERLTGLRGLDQASTLERSAAARLLQALVPEPERLAILLKGGHGRGEQIEDLLLVGLAEQPEIFRHARIKTSSTHGTGCTLSAALAARLARGDDARAATRGAIDYLHGALNAAYPIGRGHGPVNHLFALARS
jgi:hydroxymethylpyrimidine/phosphomethylpyrimidine kinase